MSITCFFEDHFSVRRMLMKGFILLALVGLPLAGQAQTIDVGDFVWVDTNANGVQEFGEPGLSNATVRLFSFPASNLVATAITDGSGFYGFTNLPSGDYFIQIIVPPSLLVYVTTNDAAGDDNLDSDFDDAGFSDVFTYSGSSLTNIDAGYVFFDPKVTLVKTADPAPDGSILYATNTQLVTYTFLISNASAKAHLDDIILSDVLLFTNGPVFFLQDAFDCIGPGETITYTTQDVIYVDRTNVAEVFAFPKEFKQCRDIGLPPISTNDEAIVLLSNPGITLDKTWTSPTNRPAAVGENLQFVIDIVNTGNVDLAVIELDDTYDTNYLSFVSAVPPEDTTSPGTVSWLNLLSSPLNVGASTSVVITFTGIAGTGGLETNTVVASGTTTTNFPPEVLPPITNEAPYEIVDPSVSIVKTLINPTNRPAVVGETNVFEIVILNTGDITLDTVPLDDVYPPALLDYESAVPTPDSVVPLGTLSWTNVGPLTPLQSTTVTVWFIANASGSDQNFAQTQPTTTNDIPVPPDDDFEGFTNVNPSVSIEKTLNAPNGRPAAVGETNEFIITVVNTGDITLDTVPVVDTFPTALLSYTSAVPMPDSTAPAGTLTWTNVGPLVPLQSTSLVVRFVALTSGSGTNLSQTSPTTTNDIPVPPDEDPEGFTNVNPSVSIVKTLISPNGRPAAVGETNAFTITVQNTGDITLDTVPVVDTFDPALLTVLNSTPPPNGIGPGVLTWNNVGPLVVGQSTTITTRFVAADSGIGTNFVSTAPTTTSGIPVPPDDDPEGYTNVNPSIQIIKTLITPTNRPTIVGETNYFSITVTNTGDYPIDIVQVSDIHGTNLLAFVESIPSPDGGGDEGFAWNNLGGPLDVGGSITVTACFRAIDAGIGTNLVTVTPTITNGVPVEGDDDPEGYTNITISIGDTFWIDLNTNGVIDLPAEDLNTWGLNGVDIWLLPVVGGVTGTTPIATSTTANAMGQNGYYSFTGLPYGVYTVTPDPDTVPPLLVITSTPNSYLIDPDSVDFPPDGMVTNADFGRNSGSLTPVELISFTATRSGNTVQLDWETATEVDSAGFNLYRASTAYRDARLKLNGALIPSVGGEDGATYSFTDPYAYQQVSFLYWLEEVATDGATETFGPVGVYSVGFGNQRLATATVDGGGLVRISYDALLAAGVNVGDVDPAKLKVLIDGEEVATYLSTESSVLQSGDYLLFYADGSAESGDVALAAGQSDRKAMDWIYARPARGGDVEVIDAAEDGATAFAITGDAARTMISGFDSDAIWVIDTTDPASPGVLYGYVVIQGSESGEYALYFSVNPEEVTGGIAVPDEDIVELEGIRGE